MMRRFRSPISLFLCIVVFASLFSGFAASAAPLKPHQVACLDKPANVTADNVPQRPLGGCCFAKVQPDSITPETLSAPSPSVIDCCKPPSKLPIRGKAQISANLIIDPCAPVVDGSCGITYPAGSVVGNIPFNQAAYYAPGKLAGNVTINAGTYWVTGLGKDDQGNGFYQIVVACQFLFVPQMDVVPSYQSPWSGQPLPTTPPVS